MNLKKIFIFSLCLTFGISECDFSKIKFNDTLKDIKIINENKNANNIGFSVPNEDGSGSTTVSLIKPTSISIESELKLNIYDTYSFSINYYPENTSETYKKVSWSSSNEDILTVDENGNIEALRYGNATVIASLKSDNSIFTACNISISNTNLDSYFKDSEFTYDEDNEIAIYSGTLIDNDNCEFFDDILDSSIIKYSCKYSINNETFTLDVSKENVNLNTTHYICENQSFINDNGNIDANLYINNENHLLSEFYNNRNYDDITDEDIELGVLEPNNKNEGWFIVGLIFGGIPYLIVSEIAEQIIAKNNLKKNQKIEEEGNGVDLGNYITNQHNVSTTGKKCGNYHFGKALFTDVGCEVASVYNLLIKLGRPEKLSTTINNFEKWAIEFSFGWGHLGSQPKAIYRYLKKYNINYKMKINYKKFVDSINLNEECNIIMSYWNKEVSYGLHTFYIRYIPNNEKPFLGYNVIGLGSYYTYSSIEDISKRFGGFICGYII